MKWEQKRTFVVFFSSTVAITGSSGKTTVKEMVAAILSRLGEVLATKGNFNNDIYFNKKKINKKKYKNNFIK